MPQTALYFLPLVLYCLQQSTRSSSSDASASTSTSMQEKGDWPASHAAGAQVGVVRWRWVVHASLVDAHRWVMSAPSGQCAQVGEWMHQVGGELNGWCVHKWVMHAGVWFTCRWCAQ
eukprot:scaffold107238_cov23-Tisochrysis_lutea.AAC.2